MFLGLGLVLSIGFCFDSGSNIEIAGRVISVLVFFGIVFYAIWHSEIKSYKFNYTPKQLIISILKSIIGFIIIFYIICAVQFFI